MRKLTRTFYTTHAFKVKRRAGTTLLFPEAFGIGFGRVNGGRVLLPARERRRRLGRNTVFLVGPFAEIYQLASFGAEGAVRIVLQLNGLTTGRTLHRKKIKMIKRSEREREVEAKRGLAVLILPL